MPTFFSDAKRARDYEPHEHPVLTPERVTSAAPGQQELLLAIYGEVCQNWRTLLDVRFKLLGFVPTVSFVLIGMLLSSKDWLQGVSTWPRVVLACLGVVATMSLFLYERRNSDLYTDLGSRARRIEYELGVHTGAYLGRLKRSNWLIDHKTAVNLVYGAALVSWLVAIAALICAA